MGSQQNPDAKPPTEIKKAKEFSDYIHEMTPYGVKHEKHVARPVPRDKAERHLAEYSEAMRFFNESNMR